MVGTEKVELEILSRVSKVANSTLDFDLKLEKIVEVIAEKLERDVCYIVLRENGSDTLTLKAAVGLNPDSIGHVMLAMGEGITGWVAEHMEPVALEVASEDPRYMLVPQTGEEKYNSMLAVPIVYDDRCIGVMNVMTVAPYRYADDEITLLSTIANDVGGIINTARLYQDAKKSLDALASLYDMSKALISTLDLGTLLERIATSSAKVIGAKGCILRLINNETGLLEIKASHGLSMERGKNTEVKLGESIAGKVAAEAKPILITDIFDHPDFLNVTGAIVKSLLCVPLIVKGNVIGTIALYDKETATRSKDNVFTKEDEDLLTTFASHAALAVENAFIYERSEELSSVNRRRARELGFLYDMANAMRTTLKLDNLLHIILTAITMGGGMGFNRAMLFMVNERARTLQGMLGIGPSSSWEAGEIWASLPSEIDLKRWTVRDEEIEAQKQSPFNRMVRSMRVSYDAPDTVFARAIAGRHAIVVGNAETDPLAGPEIASLVGSDSFATVPLTAKDRVVSIVVVDNKFTSRVITDDDMRLLDMFANQAGLAIESSMAYMNLERANIDLKEAQDRLIQSEKMAALGEMAASIAHEIKNPLTVIGGFAARLAKKEPVGPGARYSKIIRDEARRLEKILDNVLDFSKDKKPLREACSVNEVCKETVAMYADDFSEKGVSVKLELGSDVTLAALDPRQIKQAVINVISNSEQAMSGRGGEITIKTWMDEGRENVILEISDTAGGIPAEAMENIFNPFFTTKDRGTGLGLAITDKIIRNHGGEIDVINREGVGVSFIIRLPAGPVRRHETQTILE
jgi:signal transduction histidine kinase/putative methionine-R-sulfoxide reductase with GAF domain